MKKILILGASSDIGLLTTRIFLRSGWHVTAHYSRNYKGLKNFANKYNNLKILKFDLKNIAKFEKYILKNKFFLRKFDAFIGLSGYLKSTNFQNFKIKDFYDHLNVNFFSNLLIAREVLKGMEKKRWGRIVLTSSIGTKFGGGKNSLPYSLSKFNNEFFPSYYKNLYSKNITINTLQIGVTNTKLHKKIRSKNLKSRVKLIPLKRMADPAEVANYIFYLCSKENSLLTGSVINISGGE